MNPDPVQQHFQDVEERIREQGESPTLKASAEAFLATSIPAKYSYNFSWLGRPIIQYPQDMVAMQELIWKIQPTLILETGIAHGGSLILSASLLELNAACGGPAEAKVLGLDIDIREHNRREIEAHPMSRRIEMLEGSSISDEVIARVRERAAGEERVLVCLDSNHTHDHVLKELEAYAGLTTVGSYCVVFDTIVDDLPEDFFTDRPWKPGDNPKSAVREFLKDHPEFEIDHAMDHQLLISVAPQGYLKRVAP
jgi:cephalosporin hydroxylase